MTAQIPDNLVNEHPRINFDGLYLYGIIRGDIHTRFGWGEDYQFDTPPTPPQDATPFSALWRGYIATFRLDSAGEIELVSYHYARSLLNKQMQQVSERLTGDFWLVMKREFFGLRTYIPFRDGRIVENEVSWVQEEPYEARPALMDEVRPRRTLQ